MRLPIILQILLFAVLNGYYIAVEGAFSATVESGEEHCYNVIAPAGVQSVIHGNFDILDDDESPDPIGVVLYDSKMVSKCMSPLISIIKKYISFAININSILMLLKISIDTSMEIRTSSPRGHILNHRRRKI